MAENVHDRLLKRLKDKNIEIEDFKDILKDVKKIKYGLNWEEHTEDIEECIKNSKLTLKEEEDLCINYGYDYTDNILIEGDNLASLLAMRESGEKVDVIYIDPPYNTGNEFVYNDKIVDKEDSFKHSKWLSFMEKRLKVARDLLTDEGVIFVSIDDNEQANLKLLMNEVFGKKNVETMVWNKTAEGNSGSLKQVKRIRSIHEYICIGYKYKPGIVFNKIQEPNEKLGSNSLTTANLAKNNSQKKNKEEDIFDIVAPNGKVWRDEWKFKKEKIDKLLNDNMLYFGKSGNNKPRLIIPTGLDRTVYQTSIFNIGSPTLGKKDLKNVLDAEFSYPKPISLIKRFLQLYPNKNAKVLDFFAGSGTTGHAVLELNKEDGGSRSFILCNNNENNICKNITYERIKSVIKGYTTSKGVRIEGIKANLKYLKTDVDETGLEWE